jgi:hypothetical protein
LVDYLAFRHRRGRLIAINCLLEIGCADGLQVDDQMCPGLLVGVIARRRNPGRGREVEARYAGFLDAMAQTGHQFFRGAAAGRCRMPVGRIHVDGDAIRIGEIKQMKRRRAGQNQVDAGLAYRP